MKRFIWITLLAGGAVIALMAASLILGHLQEKAAKSGPGPDLKDSVATLRKAFTDWDYALARRISDIPPETYQQLFDDAHSDNSTLRRRFQGVLASMDAFPSIRFSGSTPEQASVAYETVDGTSLTKPVVVGRWKDGGFHLVAARFFTASTDNSSTRPISFHEGDNLSLEDVTEKLFTSLTSTEPRDFTTLMMLDNATAPNVTRQLDDVRAQVMACRADRLKQLLPRVERLPRGTRSFQLAVRGTVDEKRLWLDLLVVPGNPVRMRHFRAGLIEKSEPPVKAPPAEHVTPEGRN
jgi:hypothetical protein